MAIVASLAHAERASPSAGRGSDGPATSQPRAKRSKTQPATEAAAQEETKEVVEGYGEWRPRRKRFRPDPLPRTCDDAPTPAIEVAMRTAPPVPDCALPYAGGDAALTAAREILQRVPTFANFRATIPHATWTVHPAYEWRVRRARQCLADLRAQGVRAKRLELDPERVPGEPGQPATVVVKVKAVANEAPGPDEAEDEAAVFKAVPVPVLVHGEVGGVRFTPGAGASILISCELAARLRVIAEVVARHGVDQVVIASAHRRQPFSSFHTMGLGLDIGRFHVREPLPGPHGELSPWLTVLTDFYATPDRETCDPELLGPGRPYGRNERGRTLLRIACDLHATGAFSSVLTPNYNPGHRDHFHLDIRPDDPRVFLR